MVLVRETDGRYVTDGYWIMVSGWPEIEKRQLARKAQRFREYRNGQGSNRKDCFCILAWMFRNGGGPASSSPHFSPGGMIMAQDFSLQRVLATEARSGHYARGSMPSPTESSSSSSPGE